MKTVSAIKLINTNDPIYNKLKVGKRGNRVPAATSVGKLAQSISKCNLMEFRPILVQKENKRKGDYIIIDGQTRFMACKKLNKPVYAQFIEGEEEISEGIVSILNTNQRNWTLTDFGNYWKEQSDQRESYSSYMTYFNSSSVSHGILLSICRGLTSRGRDLEFFKNGELEWTDAVQKNVDEMLHKFNRLKNAAFNPALTPSTLRKQTFQSAILTALHLKGFNYNKFLENLYDAEHSFNKLGKTTAFQEEIFRIERL
jgi:hypothetical protein